MNELEISGARFLFDELELTELNEEFEEKVKKNMCEKFKGILKKNLNNGCHNCIYAKGPATRVTKDLTEYYCSVHEWYRSEKCDLWNGRSK